MITPLEQARVAIVHDWLVTYAGAERVLEQMLNVLPQADLFSLIDLLPAEKRDFIQAKCVRTSFLQRIPLMRTSYRQYLPLMPLAIEQLDLSGYDLVISSSHAVAKGVLTGPDQLHICMCYSPIRYAWDLQHQYLRESGLERGPKSWLARSMLHKIRLWDARTSNGVDHFIAISKFVARRIWKTYRREAKVIYPPVDTQAFELCSEKADFYLCASRMVPYKRIELIIDAFAAMPEKRLVVIGDGPDYPKIAGKAGENVTLLGFQPFEVLMHYMQRAIAFVFAAEEDFGIVPVEAQACGTPVIAYGKGGVLETVLGEHHHSPTGIFFPSQTPEAIIRAVQCFESARQHFDPAAIRAQAERFSKSAFTSSFSGFVQSRWLEFRRTSEAPFA